MSVWGGIKCVNFKSKSQNELRLEDLLKKAKKRNKALREKLKRKGLI